MNLLRVIPVIIVTSLFPEQERILQIAENLSGENNQLQVGFMSFTVHVTFELCLTKIRWKWQIPKLN